MARKEAPNIERQLACVQRELKMREQVYPRWVREGKMTQRQMDQELEDMRAVEATLQSIREQGDLFGGTGS